MSGYEALHGGSGGITEIPEHMMSSICWVQITIYSGSSQGGREGGREGRRDDCYTYYNGPQYLNSNHVTYYVITCKSAFDWVYAEQWTQ